MNKSRETYLTFNKSRISLALVSKRARWGNTAARPRTHFYFANGDWCMQPVEGRVVVNTSLLGTMHLSLPYNILLSHIARWCASQQVDLTNC